MVTKFQNRVMNSKSTGENSRSPFNEDSIVAKCLASIADKDINNVKETRSSSPPDGCGTSNKINVSSPSPLTKNVMVGTMTTATTGIPASSSSSSASSSSSCVSPSFPNSHLDEPSKSVERKESTKSHINKTFNSRGDNIKSVKDDERKAQAGNRKCNAANLFCLKSNTFMPISIHFSSDFFVKYADCFHDFLIRRCVNLRILEIFLKIQSF